MLPGFIRFECDTSYRRPVVANGPPPAPMVIQAVTPANLAAPGCTIECYCSIFTYKCYERCNGRITRAWDNGWCFSFGW